MMILPTCIIHNNLFYGEKTATSIQPAILTVLCPFLCIDTKVIQVQFPFFKSLLELVDSIQISGRKEHRFIYTCKYKNYTKISESKHAGHDGL